MGLINIKQIKDLISTLAAKLNLSGGTMTGPLTLSGDPTENNHASNKKYVDDSVANAGGGDMLKSVYDTNDSGRVDKAESVDDGTNITTAAQVKAASNHVAASNNPHGVTKSQVGLGSADNTADADKPVSSAQQTALNLKVNIADIVDNVTSSDVDKPLSANQGKILKDLITGISTALIPQGTWNASTNTPDISGATQTGFYWIVNVAGATDLGGITDWEVNDWVVKTATGWAKVDNSDKVLSVNGQTGVISLTTANIAEVANKKYVTDAEKTKLANTSGINTGDKDLEVVSVDLVCPSANANTNFDVSLPLTPLGGEKGLIGVSINGVAMTDAEIVSMVVRTLTLNVPYAVLNTDTVTVRYHI